MTECYIIIIEDIKGFSHFMSFLEHNCSIMPYFLSNFINIQCKILKILPISLISEIKTKQKSPNVLILKYNKKKDKIRQY